MSETQGTHYSQFVGSIPVQSGAPDNPRDGAMWLDSDNNVLKIYYDGSWLSSSAALTTSTSTSTSSTSTSSTTA